MSEKWLVVTGGGNGIGAMIARRGAEAGWSVALWDLDGDGAQAVAESLDVPTRVDKVDVSDEASVQAALDELPEAPQAVVSNAGTVRFGPLLDLAVSDFEQAIRVNRSDRSSWVAPWPAP